MNDLLSIRTLAFISVMIYFAFDYWDSRHVKDEREELIRLKSLELAHKATLGILSLVTFVFLFYPWLSALYIILPIILAALYTEMAGKIYYRNKL